MNIGTIIIAIGVIIIVVVLIIAAANAGFLLNAIPVPLSGSCCTTSDCATGLICQDGFCLIPPGGSCGYNPTFCAFDGICNDAGFCIARDGDPHVHPGHGCGAPHPNIHHGYQYPQPSFGSKSCSPDKDSDASWNISGHSRSSKSSSSNHSSSSCDESPESCSSSKSPPDHHSRRSQSSCDGKSSESHCDHSHGGRESSHSRDNHGGRYFISVKPPCSSVRSPKEEKRSESSQNSVEITSASPDPSRSHRISDHRFSEIPGVSPLPLIPE